EERRAHHLLQHAIDAGTIGHMAGTDVEFAARIEERAEMGQPADMVVMRMGEKQVGIDRRLLLQGEAQRADTRARIHDQQMPAAADLQAGGIAAVAHYVRRTRGNAAAYPPGADVKVVFPHSGLLLPASVEGRSAS